MDDKRAPGEAQTDEDREFERVVRILASVCAVLERQDVGAQTLIDGLMQTCVERLIAAYGTCKASVFLRLIAESIDAGGYDPPGDAGKVH